MAFTHMLSVWELASLPRIMRLTRGFFQPQETLRYKRLQ